LSETENGEEKSIIDALLGANDAFYALLMLPAGGSREPISEETAKNRRNFFKMMGCDVFRESRNVMEICALEILPRNNLTVDEIDLIVTHQVNLRIKEAARDRLEICAEKVCVTVDKYGNTSGSSCIIAMDSLIKAGKIKQGSKVVSAAFGAGWT
jgi:3-oxoacyl-[acyl-carrier-protein] synthase-3